jgi:hypothetical protein
MAVWSAIIVVSGILLAALAIGAAIYCLFKLVDEALRKCGF